LENSESFISLLILQAKFKLHFCTEYFNAETKEYKKIVMLHSKEKLRRTYTRVYPKVSGLAASWNGNCKWYSSLPLHAVVSVFYESV
jgi:hypothetical protein